MIEITPNLRLDERALEMRFIRASGPGGQHVNKVSTAVQLRFDLARAELPAMVRARAKSLAGRQLSREGILTIEASRYRSQERNRRDAIERLVALLKRAATPPRPRKATRPSAAARRRRLAEKRHRGGLKATRGRVPPDRE